jgi:phosphatidylserine decarboxylase
MNKSKNPSFLQKIKDIKIAKEGFPFIFILAIFFIISLFFKLIILPILFLGLTCAVLYFFRDPKRALPTEKNTIFSPADGTIVEINETTFDDKPYTQIVIFLSIFNVHINRIPYSGKIIKTRYFPGNFFAANKKDIELKNERMETLIATKNGFIKVVQIAGLIARKIVNYLESDQEVVTGEKFGLIKFGSRTDIYFPSTAKCLVKIGDTVEAGITKFAKFNP